MLVALGAWALSSPVGSSPDEDYHLASVWCGQGLRDGMCEPGEAFDERSIPTELRGAACFAHSPDMSASCQQKRFYVESDAMVSTARGNFVGDYPPVFHFVQSLLTGPNASVSVLAMRVANAMLFVGLVTALYLVLPVGLRRPLVIASLVTAVPLGMFLIPSINPSSWALLSATTLMLSVLGYITAEHRRRRIALGVLAAAALAVGAGARADASIYALVAIGAAVILSMRAGWPYVRRLVYPAVLAVAAGVAFLSAGQSSAADGSTGTAPPFTLSWVVGIMENVPDLWIGGLGKWGLGWLDTPMPAVVWVACWGLYSAVLFVASSGTTLRRGIAVGLVGAATLLIPTYIQFLSGAPVGSYVQPRYILPLLIILAATTMVRLEGAAFRFTRGQRWILVAILAGTNAIALHTNIRRYVVGTDGMNINLDARVEWWWAGMPVGPMAVWVIGALAFTIGIVLVSAELVLPAPAATQEPVLARDVPEDSVGDTPHKSVRPDSVSPVDAQGLSQAGRGASTQAGA